jgi:hypothetical protein
MTGTELVYISYFIINRFLLIIFFLEGIIFGETMKKEEQILVYRRF